MPEESKDKVEYTKVLVVKTIESDGKVKLDLYPEIKKVEQFKVSTNYHINNEKN